MGTKPGILVLFTTGLIIAAGSAVWEKNFAEWTDKDANQILKDSPWAKQIPMPSGGRPGVAVIEPGAAGGGPPSASLGNPSNTTTGQNMSVAANPGSAGGADPSGQHTLPSTPTQSGMTPSPGAPEVMPSITVIWASAAPVRLAVLKLRSEGKAISDEEIARALSPRPNYTLAVVGLPAPDADVDPKALAPNAVLKVKGKGSEAASESDYRKIGSADVYFFRFPKSGLTISESEPEVEFSARIGKAEVKKKFAVAAMTYQGKLSL